MAQNRPWNIKPSSHIPDNPVFHIIVPMCHGHNYKIVKGKGGVRFVKLGSTKEKNHEDETNKSLNYAPLWTFTYKSYFFYMNSEFF